MPYNSNRLNVIRYSLYAPTYSWSARVLEQSRKMSVEMLGVQPGEKVLIIGAGTGNDLDHLPMGCKIVATDITPAVVKRIKKRNSKLNHQLETLVMDGQNLHFEKETFDKVILHLILTVIPNPTKALKETERLLKPGGRVVVFDKFIPNGKKASPVRRFFNLFTSFLFSSLTLNFENILAHTRLKVVSDQKANIEGYFRIILLEKPIV
ncbi:MAG TPA: methyltransferase domain-containing protein [Prolixibacteraceae bacterium]|nr:methyltransferase domain-containing protein [Prolixibacteraceae bacterium]